MVAVVLIAAYLAFLFGYLHSLTPGVLSIASVQTERISFVAVDGQKAAFYVQGVRLSADGMPPGDGCVAGLVVPVNGATVWYGRVGDGATEIGITAADGPAPGHIAAVLKKESGTQQTLASPVYLATEASCVPSSPLRLPIWGTVSIGQEFRPQALATPPDPTFLLAGSLKVWGKTVEFKVQGKTVWGDPPSLYAVAELALPVGSRLEAWKAADNLHHLGPIWWGIAYADPIKPALTVDVATEARELALYRPGGPDNLSTPGTSEADVVGISWLTQITHDPTILELHAAAAACIGLVELLLKMNDSWRDFRKEREKLHERERLRGQKDAPTTQNRSA